MANQTNESTVKMESEIVQFFSGRKVLITSGLGILEKLLIEKLLRCCNVATIHVLIRTKNGKIPRERMQELIKIPLYERLRKERPYVFQKLIVIEGNLSSMNLGLSQEDRSKLLNTNVIFHGAAIMQSNQKLSVMTNVNVRATKEVLRLAKEMPDLKAFVHLSTVYAQAQIKSIEERHYPPPMETDELLTLINVLSEKKLEEITPSLIDHWPNTSTFTKAIAEHTVLKYSKGIPACIVRPSVVTSTWKEPIEGWTDSVYGPVSLLVGSSLSLLRTIHCHTDRKLDFVPADYVTSCMIAAAWRTNVRNIKKEFKVNVETGLVPDVEKIAVYNYVSSCQRPITWNTFRKHVRAHGSKIPGVRDIRLQCMFWNSRLWMHKILMWLFHLLPAVMVDAAAILTGREPRWYKTYKLIDAHLSATSYFTTQQWHFRNETVLKLWKQMNAADREIFEFDLSIFDWNEYIKRMVHGIRDFVDQNALDFVESKLAEYIVY